MNFISSMIKLKQQDERPYMSSGPTFKTDMDTFPYPRFYRGVYDNSEAIVFNREAGWHPREDACYAKPYMTPSEDNLVRPIVPINYFTYMRPRESEKLITGNNLLKYR